MSLPVVAIVGRPNVGKSSLFNCLAGRRISIVEPTAGVTRDRVATLVDFGDDQFFELVDTGGIGIVDTDALTDDVEKQINHAIDSASLILFVVDVRTGLMPLDEDVAERLRLSKKPIICVANKCDSPELESFTAEFNKFGFGKVFCVSAAHWRGKVELLREIVSRLPPADAPAEVVMKLAIVGRRNVGKSTFINSLAESERVIVSEVPGTTRDSVDVRIERDGKVFLAIDTAGVRKKKSLASDIEFYSLARAERSIRRADVVLLFFDARLRVSSVDKQLADYVLQNHKPAVFVINKWDLARDRFPTERYVDYMRAVFPMLDHVPLAFISANKGKNVDRLLHLAKSLYKQAGKRVATGELNRLLKEALARRSPPMRQNRTAKIYYATQVGSHPPTIVLFTNNPDLFDNTYRRYLTNFFRDNLPFREVPIKLELRAKRRGDMADAASRRIEKAKKAQLDLSDLEFTTETTDDEITRGTQKKKEFDLWDF
jgi:GTP-binding protein